MYKKLKDAGNIRSEKFLYFEGLRGIAAFVVVITHLTAGFYPGLYFRKSWIIHNDWELSLAKIWIFNLFYAGNFAVCIFFVMSGYVLTYSVLRSKSNNLLSLFFRRYIRLAIPLLATSFLSYLIAIGGFYYNKEASAVTLSISWLDTFFRVYPDIIKMLEETLVTVFTVGAREYNPAIWTMEYELKGSFLVFSFLWLFNSRVLRISACLPLLIYFYKDNYLCFVAGMLLYDINEIIKERFPQQSLGFKYLFVAIAVLALYLGAFTYGNKPGSIYWEINALVSPFSSPFTFTHMLGAILLIFSIDNLHFTQRILQVRFFRFLGRISFSLYLVHMILLCSMASYVFLLIVEKLSYNLAVAISTAMYISVAIVVSHIVSLYVDTPGVKFSKYVAYKIDNFVLAHKISLRGFISRMLVRS